MKASPHRYHYKEVERLTWIVRWRQPEGMDGRSRRAAKTFPTKQDAENWIRRQKVLSDTLTKQERAAWERIPAEERRTILACRSRLEKLGKPAEQWIEATKLLEKKPTLNTTDMRVKDAVEEFMARKRDGQKKDTVGAEWFYTLDKRTAKFAGEFGEKYLSEITKKDIEAWIEKQGKSHKTFNDYRALLMALWECARLQCPALSNPAAMIVPYAKEAPDYGPVPSVDWTRTALLKAIESRAWVLLRAMLSGFGLGIRQSEIDGLTGVDIRPNSVRLGRKITKNGDQRNIERSPRFAAIFDMLECLKTDGFLVEDGWEDRLRSLLRDSGIEKIDNVMRHAFVSYFCVVAPTVEDVRKVIGHSTSSKVLETNYKSIDILEGTSHRPLLSVDGEAYFSMFGDVEKALRLALPNALSMSSS